MHPPSVKKIWRACPFYQSPGAMLLAAAFFGMMVSGCAYRFSNLHMKAPPGARTIAVESIYDTGKLAIPHEILWEQLQKQFAINGRLKLAPANQADLYLRAHIFRSVLTPTQIEKNSLSEPDDFLMDKDGVLQPHPLSAYPDYNVASSYAKSETLNLNVRVEIWNLHTRKSLFTKDYGVSTTWQVFDSSLPPEYLFLKSEETFESSFSSMAEGLAKTIVVEFLSRPF